MKMYAIDTSDFHTMNTQFGIMALPTLILFHNSKAVAKYNQSEFEVENFAKRKIRVDLLLLNACMLCNFKFLSQESKRNWNMKIANLWDLYASRFRRHHVHIAGAPRGPANEPYLG